MNNRIKYYNSADKICKEIDKTIIILPAYIIIPVIIVGIVAIYIIYRRISLRRARGARKKAKKLLITTTVIHAGF